MEITSDIRNKENALVERIKAAGKLAVAFSGGVDSTYLLYKAHEVLGDNAVAVTVKSQVITKDEFEWTVSFCEKIGVKQIVLNFDVFAVEEFENNPPDRCYYCKRRIFGSIKEAAEGYVVADGSNVDDQGDYRPGMRAIAELGISSPLKDSGLTKNDIRMLSKEADPSDIVLMTYERTRKEISAELKRLGFKYVTIDIDGYRVGSMNEVLK